MLVRLSSVCKAFIAGVDHVVALDRVNLEVSEGELVCVYGASGSGKTTLLNTISGIDLPDSGEVTVADQVLNRMSESGRAAHRLAHIGMVFQSNNLLAELTAMENIVLPLLVQGESKRDAQARGLEALTAVGLAPEIGTRLPGRMSGGQRQRVGIARALAGKRRLLLADEPTGSLDSDNARQLFALLHKLCEESQAAVIVATHDPLARDSAHAVYGMRDGVLAAP